MVEGDREMHVWSEGHRVEGERAGREQCGWDICGASGGTSDCSLSGVPGVYLEIQEKRPGRQSKTH